MDRQRTLVFTHYNHFWVLLIIWRASYFLWQIKHNASSGMLTHSITCSWCYSFSHKHQTVVIFKAHQTFVCSAAALTLSACAPLHYMCDYACRVGVYSRRCVRQPDIKDAALTSPHRSHTSSDARRQKKKWVWKKRWEGRANDEGKFDNKLKQEINKERDRKKQMYVNNGKVLK